MDRGTPRICGGDMTTYLTSTLNVPIGTTYTETSTMGWNDLVIGLEIQYSATSLISIDNYGTILVSGHVDFPTTYKVAGLYALNGASGPGTALHNEAGATFTVTATGNNADAYGFYATAGLYKASFINDGTFQLTSTGSATGVLGADTVTNSGTLTVSGGFDSIGVALKWSNGFKNSGTIEVTGYGVSAVGVADTNMYGTFENSGTIMARNTNGLDAAAICMAGSTTSVQTLSNSGTIRGDYAFLEYQYFVSTQASVQDIENTGKVYGHSDLGTGNDIFHNTGTVTGSIALGQGDDLYDGALGRMTGSVYGGGGRDTIIGGDDNNLLYGEEGGDTISGNGGDDYIDGGIGNDSLSGGNGNDELYGGYGDDTIDGGDGADWIEGGGGADRIIGGAGADTIVIGAASESTGTAFDTVDGFDFTADRLRLTAVPTAINAPVAGGTLSAASFAGDLSLLASSDHLAAHGAVLVTPNTGDFAGDTFLVIDANGQAGYQDGADIVVRLDSPVALDKLSLDDFVAGGSTYRWLPLEFSSSFVAEYGSLPVARQFSDDLIVYAGQTMTLAVDHELGDIGLGVLYVPGSTGSAVVTNYGSIAITSGTTNRAILDAISGRLYNAAGGVVTITGTGSNTNVVGITGNLSNDGTFTIRSAEAGWICNSADSLVNTGTITVTAAQAAFGTNAIVDFVNSGSIAITADGAGAVAQGILFQNGSKNGYVAGATIDNSGSLVVASGDQQGTFNNDAIQITRQLDFFRNSGTIRITDMTAAYDCVAVYFNITSAYASEQVFNNSGLIAGDYAFLQSGQSAYPGANGKTIINNTGTIRGKIDITYEAAAIDNDGQIVGDIRFGAGNDRYDGSNGQLSGTLSAGAGADTLTGGAGADVFSGGAGNDTLAGGGGANTLDGGADTDTVVFALRPADYAVVANSDGSYTVDGINSIDTLTNIEQASFAATGQTLSLADFQAQSFNALAYIASYADLIRGLGDNAQWGLQHYFNNGLSEGRTISFNTLNYIASYGDLIGAFGDNQTWGVEHYIRNGFGEGRTVTFNPLNYIASYSDLIAAFGDNQTWGAEHYIRNGYAEGRKITFDPLAYLCSYGDLIAAFGDNQAWAAEHYIKNGYGEGRKISFNALNYIASYSDLIQAFGDNVVWGEEHYIKNGYAEGRKITFDPLAYICSYSDLIRAFGDNQTWAAEHYIKNGHAEGRTITFNALNYIASYGDLIQAFGDNVISGEEHYIRNGYAEGRKVTFDPVAYLISNTDLGSCGFTAADVTGHYIRNGYWEHRSASGAFGTEQTGHDLSIGGAVSDTLATSGDQDWFGVTLTAGQSYTFTLSGTDGGNGTLADPFLGLYNAHGLLVTSNNDALGHDSKITFTATASGTFYLVAAAHDMGTGTYKLFGATGG